MAAEPAGFDEGMTRVVIFVHLVAGHDDDALQFRHAAACLQHVGSAHDIGIIGAQGIAIRFPDQRLRRHVHHHLRPRLDHHFTHPRRIADVADEGAGRAAHQCPEIDFALRCQRIAGHLRAESLQPQMQPCALEAGVASEQNPPAAPEGCIGFIFLQRSHPRGNQGCQYDASLCKYARRRPHPSQAPMRICRLTNFRRFRTIKNRSLYWPRPSVT